MKIRTLQWRFKDFEDTYYDFEWSERAAEHYRRNVRRAYKYARHNGVNPGVARHLCIDLMLIGQAAI